MINNEYLHFLSSVEAVSVDIDKLVDLNSVPVNKNLTKEARILQFIEEIKNPYCFKVGNGVVKTQFSDSGLSLQNALVKSTGRQ